jgi:hypothetical protein
MRSGMGIFPAETFKIYAYSFVSLYWPKNNTQLLSMQVNGFKEFRWKYYF